MRKKYIKIRGANEHNLKNIDVDIPRDELVVITGLSGSGKSSLAFDTVYAEGQRRYMESLSSYARQFLGQMEKPDVESIEGLSPAISIDQKSTNRNPRSTVGTVTETYDYLRLLYARAGVPHCPKCGKEIKKQTVDEMADKIMKLPEKTRIQLLAPVVRGKKGMHIKVLDSARRSGYVRVVIDGNVYDLSEDIKLDKNLRHNIEIVVDRLVIREGIEKRLTDSIEQLIELTDGLMIVDVIAGEKMKFSTSFSCPDCGISIDEIEPRSFSFNNPFGACPVCSGIGYHMEFDPDLMIADENLSINEGAISVMGWMNSKDPSSYTHAMLLALSLKYDFSLDTAFKDLPDRVKNIIIYGTKDEKVTVYYESQYGKGNEHEVAFEGVLKNVSRRYRECYSEKMKEQYEEYMRITPCESCHGARLKPSSLAVTINDKNIYELSEMPMEKFYDFVSGINLSGVKAEIAGPIIKEIKARSGFMLDVGLSYLSLSRTASTLSGGESQRIRLATQIGSGLTGVAYILDEPSIGLHQRDNDRLIATLKNLRDLGNSVLVVEHDEDTMKAADCIVDIGPGAGEHGGELVCIGNIEKIKKCRKSITGQYLSGKRKIEVPSLRKKAEKFFTVKGAAENNLKNIDVNIPISLFTCVTGVSGSGKSTLVNEIIYKSLARKLNKAKIIAGKHDKIISYEYFDKIINIDQAPIGRTPRSNPATYTGVFDHIRDLFAMTNDAKGRGYEKGRFSFNVKGGRCEACKGDGIVKIEMHFLPDVYVPCEVCGGKRYNRETLEVRYKGKNIFDVLDMTVEEAYEFFKNVPVLKRKLKTLMDVGLSYIKLGQPSTKLSGGEAQRIKLASELAKRSTGKTLYILDEPTTGLHFEDVKKLIDILIRLREKGNTLIVIEHNMDVIKCADYIIDMGPEGGSKGGMIVGEGSPEEIADNRNSYTGKYLKEYIRL